ncbi:MULTISPECIES: hypothetical protein [Clostridium]|uniref:hypothetical protein n=1 Tax=Clostridium TaxID=1485 RepID=UPI000C071363|nr:MULTISPECIES: hypothetical protein [Clostridium]MDU4728003.1 hypothetical protein [Clostridium sp.]
MDKVFVKFDTNTLEVQGFLIEEQLEEGSEYIEIDSKTEERLRTMSNENCGTLFVVDVKNKKFESRVISLENIPLSKEEKAIKDLEEENLQLKVALAQMTEEKDSQILEIQLALAEIVEGGLI